MNLGQNLFTIYRMMIVLDCSSASSSSLIFFWLGFTSFNFLVYGFIFNFDVGIVFRLHAIIYHEGMHYWSAVRFRNGEGHWQWIRFDDGCVGKVAKNIQIENHV
jgi:hypothetical protein